MAWRAPEWALTRPTYSAPGIRICSSPTSIEEIYSLYRNLKDETFRDSAAENALAPLTRSMSGWGLKFFDYDNDGALDLIVANGHPDDRIGDRSAFSVATKSRSCCFIRKRDDCGISRAARPVQRFPSPTRPEDSQPAISITTDWSMS